MACVCLRMSEAESTRGQGVFVFAVFIICPSRMCSPTPIHPMPHHHHLYPILPLSPTFSNDDTNGHSPRDPSSHLNVSLPYCVALSSGSEQTP